MDTPKQPKARVLAYYLPQYHPIPENDEWWGKGFTEWTNVGKAKPLFPGHYQPHVPADLGYYDLRVPETRKAQADMAREYGVEGFVYWHYWFGNGRRLLERPFNEVLASGEPDFPFALAWANETWSGSFHGLKEGNVLIEQTYPGDEDYIAHFNAVLPAFKDKRYITCEGKPIFVIYIPEQVPDIKHFINLWQHLAKENGLKGIYFVAHVQFIHDEEKAKLYLEQRLNEGFSSINIVNKYIRSVTSMPIKYRIIRKLLFKRMHLIPEIKPYSIENMFVPMAENLNVIPTVVPNWDHTPRSEKKGLVLVGSTPKLFAQSIVRTLKQVEYKDIDHRFVFVKSWNEWAEGNYLEPDRRYGHSYLEALKNNIF